LLFGAAGLLLLITCANVAGLLVSRSIGRARETAIRIALGSSRTQLAVQYFMESLWVSLAAAVAGVLLSLVCVRVLLSLAGEYIPRADEVATNWTAASFALGLAFVTATLSALAPLWQAFRTPPNEVLSNGVRASASARSRRLSRVLVSGEITLAFTLISAGGLLLWQFRTLNETSPGFNPHGLMTFHLTRSGAQAGNAALTAAYASKLLDALEAIPGVTDAAVANQLPLAGCCFSSSLFPQTSLAQDLHQPVSLMQVSPSYFKTLNIPLLAGRFLTPRDTNESLLAVVIDQATATRYWPNHNAVGELGRLGAVDGDRIQVVGVVATVRNQGLGNNPMPEVYVLNSLAPMESMRFIVRSTLSPAGLASAIRRAAARIDAAQPIYAMQSMDEIIADSLTFQRIEWMVITFFALAALLMASLGVYGVTAYSVRLRTTELGTRMAVGATGGQLLRLITGDGLWLALYGILIGVFTTAAATKVVSSYFNVHQLSALPYLISILVVVTLALLASLVPGWRASILSPMVAIRNDPESAWVSARRVLAQSREQLSAVKSVQPLDSSLLTEFIDASRTAESFAEMLRVYLLNLRTKLHAESALLLEVASAGEFHCVAAMPETSLRLMNIPENGFLLNRLKFYAAPMSFAEEDIETSLRWAVSQKLHQIKELELLRTIGLRLAAPLRTRKDLIGLLLFGERDGGGDYSLAEKNLVAVCAEQFALTLENARLNQRVLEQEKIRRDVALATEVQRRLLPESSPQIPAASFGAFTLAARSVGGDYYDFLQVGERNIGIALADVAGKGIAAALIMAVVQASLRIIAADEKVSLPELAAKMNRFLHRSTGFSSYATFFYAQLDQDQRRLRYVNAGHNPPYLVRAASQNGHAAIEELTTGGIVIGMFPSANYQEAVVDLHGGDVLLAFTDGVTEALNQAEEEYGEERLKNLVRRVAHLPIVEMTSSISHDLRTWIGEAPQHDDITFIVMKISEDNK
jgi:serine phosphatase RsbU (regulator of sigma subunit)